MDTTPRHSAVLPASVDPDWTVVIEGADYRLRRVHESLLTVADGHVGTRGTREERDQGSEPLVMVAGVFDAPQAGDIPRPLPGPLWFAVDLDPGKEGSDRRILDLRHGLLWRETPDWPWLRSVRFASLARPGTQVCRIETDGDLAVGETLLLPANTSADMHTGHDRTLAADWLQVHGIGGVTATATDHVAVDADGRRLDRIAIVRGTPDQAPPIQEGLDALATATDTGVDGLLAEHRAAWLARWDHAQVDIDGDSDLQRNVRFCLFHLMASAASEGEAAVGARGLSGPAYAGHVFWDADVFVLPFLAATHPPAARAMLEYRWRRLGAARDRARAEGRQGARFPWESAHDGTEATPPQAVIGDLVLPIHTGEQQVHIVADVAWAALHHHLWSARPEDADVVTDLVVETARYWASRIEVNRDGNVHIRGVMGPDEYHPDVDDNLFTNVMARWNLQQAANLVDDRDRAATWRELADRLVVLRDPESGVHEQFVGYRDLEPLLIADVVPPPVAADLLLGHDRIQTTQVIKQADVLMAHHLVPDQLPPGSLDVDLDHYLPRTAHGSSLSPAIHAALLARLDRPDEAADLLTLAARLDLDDISGTTAGGLHLAAMGGVWQALAHGFLGLSPTPTGLRIDPRQLPETWSRLGIRVLFHGVPVTVQLTHDRCDLHAARPIALLPGSTTVPAHARHLAMERTSQGWTPGAPP
jgi:trehalose/maltose hydrolase-like predicted phosphorylase